MQRVTSFITLWAFDTEVSSLASYNYDALMLYIHLILSSFQYYKFIEIHVKSCKSNGIDCKVHGLSVIGRIKSDDQDVGLNYVFLASDDEEVEYFNIKEKKKEHDY